MSIVQKLLFDADESDIETRNRRSGSFMDNLQLPVHRWFRYSAGFSAEWVGELLREHSAGGSLRVLDPFVGSGTVVLAAEQAGLHGIGIESHPFVARIARAKLYWREDVRAFRRMAAKLAQIAERETGDAQVLGPLVAKCYPPETLGKLHALKNAWEKVNDKSPISELCWLAFISILRTTSPVGTAQWQYVLPRKTKAKYLDPLLAFEERVVLFARDMASWQQQVGAAVGCILQEDARLCAGVADGWADLIVTSPPYANNYDYADATRLEMTFLGEINGWGDLQSAVRTHLVRSCTQHVAPYASKMAEVIGAPELDVIRTELKAICANLESEKDNHGGKKQYGAMVAHYFHDLARVWQSLRRATKLGGRACFVIGDSAPYGIYVPVDRWLGELAVAAGFKSFRFEKLRDRNTKWKNRKHRVPLHEGRLWVEG